MICSWFIVREHNPKWMEQIVSISALKNNNIFHASELSNRMRTSSYRIRIDAALAQAQSRNHKQTYIIYEHWK